MKMKLISFIVIFSSISSSLSMPIVLDTMNMFAESVNLTQLANISTILNELSPLYGDITDPNITFGEQIGFQRPWQTTETCRVQLELLFDGMKNGDFWVIQMLDASAKLEAGLLYGNTFLFGNQDECTEIKQIYTYNNISNTIKGQYCTVGVVYGGSKGNLPNKNNYSSRQLLLQSSMGFCVPSGCSVQDLQNVSKAITEKYLPQLSIIFSDGFCSTEDSELEIPPRSIFCITIFAFIGFLLAVGTFADVFKCLENNSILKCFSIYTNGKKLFTAKPSEGNLHCLNGLRVMSMMLIVLGHRLIGASAIPAVNKIFIARWVDYWYNYFFLGLGFAVDTFFTISGLLIVYMHKTTTNKGNGVNWMIFLIHRLLRLTPSLALLVLFYATMLSFFEPVWAPVLDDILGQSCRKYWWTTLLYIQNYWNPSDMCVVQTWYLAVDTQLYILAPVILIFLKKFPRSTIVSLILLAFISMGDAFWVTFKHLLNATYLKQGLNEYTYLYTPTHIRVTPWLFGALTGYFIAENKNKSFQMNKLLVYFSWILSLSTLIFVLIIQKIYHDNEYNVLYSAFFNTFSRPLWGAAICIIILLCVFNHGGIVNRLLSSAPFTVLIRINYSIYLIHAITSSIIISKMRTSTYLSVFSIIHETLGDYCIVVVIATAWTLAFESPIIALEKLIFSKGRENRDNMDRKRNDINGSCETVIMR